ncbi:MAG TPA: GNAT family N-acetyltransferase [Fimbriimonas sp.]
MIVEPGLSASRNFVQTYFRIGLAIPGASELRAEGFRACVGPMEHPVCNFGADLALSEDAARRLALLATRRRAFTVYALPGDRPERPGELLVRHGFVRQYRMTVMGSAPSGASNLDVVQVSAGERLPVARFMFEQFYYHQPKAVRLDLAHATAAAKGLDLVAVFRHGGIAAAAMLCRSDGATGIYNLCVAHSMRRQGLGSEMVAWVLAQERNPVVLQCERSLERWYEKLGFASLGAVDVYGLGQNLPNAIIDVV